jgi:uncharacterized protein
MSRMYEPFLAREVAPDQVRACLGLISDTHMPQRCGALPATLPDVFRDVDLILHAGDVGELWVLDRLSAIAPVVAVHGNDETADAQRELPLQQLVTIAGQRILLLHSHHPDRAQEMALRQDDAWLPKLARLTAPGKRAGASVVVFGHAHIPLSYTQDGILLINPGAIASGSAVARQLHQTVALLFILDNQAPQVVHVDLQSPHQPFAAAVDWQAGFQAALQKYNASIIAPEFRAGWQPFEDEVRLLLDNPAQRLAFEAIYGALLRIARQCWADPTRFIRQEDVLATLDELATDERVPDELLSTLRAALYRAKQPSVGQDHGPSRLS